MCLTAPGWERIPLLINNVILGLDFCFFSVTEAQKWSFYSSVSISDVFKFDTFVRLVILFQRFLEARVVRSESDGSFTLTLSVPELERAFGKKFKSKTKYKTKPGQLLAPRPFPPANVTWFLSRPPERSAATVTLPLVVLSLSSPGSSAVSAGCTVALQPVHPLSGTIRHLVPSPHRRKASFLFPTCCFLSPCCRSDTKRFF